MSPSLVILGLAFVLWIGLHLKKSRSDGDLIPQIHPYRRLMAYIMPSRNESVVYFDTYVDAEALLRYLEEARHKHDTDITHCLVAAGMAIMLENPPVNRFVVGRRLYQRRGVSVTFSMKRKAMDREAKLATVKLRYRPGETFANLCRRIDEAIGVERSGQKTYSDREFDLLTLLPRPLLRLGVAGMQVLDYFNVLPGTFIENDPLYTSLFCANLGSLGMGAGYHHLYEWGNCGVFMMAGKIEERPVVVDGRITSRKTLHVRFTYDERVNDGLTAGHAINTGVRVLENPYEYLGCLAADGSDARPLDAAVRLSRGTVSAASAAAAAG